jgi:hypothetical protein
LNGRVILTAAFLDATGLLEEVFGTDMTANESQCAACGSVSLLGELLVFGGTMGSVRSCLCCHEMMMRINSRPGSLWLDMQGISYLWQERSII